MTEIDGTWPATVGPRPTGPFNMKYRFLIADDEPLARGRLRSFAAQEPDLEYVGEAANGSEALRLVRRLEPDFVFLDIEMPKLDGLQLAQKLTAEQKLTGDRLPLVVFTTAHANFAVDAYASNVVDYLLKPFDQERFRGALAKMRELLGGIGHRHRGGPGRERILIKAQGRYIVVRIDSINWLEAAANYVVLHTPNAKHVLRGTLADVVEQLGEETFFRIGRSHAVNLNQIAEVRMEDTGQHSVLLHGGEQLRLQRRFRELQQRLEQVHRQLPCAL